MCFEQVTDVVKLSIKQKVTTFYAVIMLLFLLIVMALFYFTLDLQIVHISHSALESAVKNSFDEIEMPGDWIEISNAFDPYVNDVTLLVYGPEGTKILGHAPQGFPENMPLRSDLHQQYEQSDETWQIYDLYKEYSNENGIWVRGIYSLSNSLKALNRLLIIMLIALPALIIISLIAGYLVTTRAFAPVQQIQKTAELIIQKRDLSNRINLKGNTRDELFKLAKTYDQLLERIEASFENEKQFTSDVSHELRTPVSVIISQAEYGLSQQDPDVMRESLQSILKQSEQISSMISQLLELSRTSHSLSLLKKESFNLAELCHLVADELSEKAQERNIQIIRKIDSEITVFADQILLMRAIINLITNSITYGKDDGFVMIDLQRDNSNVILTISDDGAGIAPEHLDKIFNRFYQVDRSRTRSQSGSSGLGLAMVRQIVEAHEGAVTAQSTLGVGSTFTVTLPQESED